MAKSEFVAIMAHEMIRTPLHQVMGVLELLGETDLTPQQAELFWVLGQCSIVIH
jgi:signal transduction histidine kinase